MAEGGDDDFNALWMEIFKARDEGLEKDKEGDEEGACGAYERAIDIISRLKRTSTYRERKEYCDSKWKDPHESSLKRLKEIRSQNKEYCDSSLKDSHETSLKRHEEISSSSGVGIVDRLQSHLRNRQDKEGTQGGRKAEETDSAIDEDQDSDEWGESSAEEYKSPAKTPAKPKDRQPDIRPRRISSDDKTKKTPSPDEKKRANPTPLKGQRENEVQKLLSLEHAMPNINTIVVEGAEGISDDDLELYFESKRGGSGDIEKIRHDDEDENIVYITFQNCTDADRITQMKHRVKGKKLQVSVMKRKKKPETQDTGGRKMEGTDSATDEDQDSDEWGESSDEENESPAKTPAKPKDRQPDLKPRRIYSGDKTQKTPSSDEKKRANPTPVKGRREKVVQKPLSLEHAMPNINTIVVEGTEGISDDDLELYFESQKGGSGDIKKIRHDDEDENTVYITFKNCTDADRITQMKHKVKGKKLQVSVMQRKKKPETEDIGYRKAEDTKSAADEDQDSNEGSESSAAENESRAKTPAKPKGRQPDIKPRKISSGDKTKKKPSSDEKKRANPTPPKGRRKKEGPKPLRLEHAMPDINTIVVEGTEGISDDDLELYFESKRGGSGDIESIRHDDDDENTVYITFKNCTDADRITQMKHKVKGNKLQVSVMKRKKKPEEQDIGRESKKEKAKPEKTDKDLSTNNKVSVKGASGLSEEDLELYFGSRKGGKGDIEDITQDDSDDDLVYITFKNDTDAERIANMSHKYKSKSLHVSLFENKRQDSQESESDTDGDIAAEKGEEEEDDGSDNDDDNKTYVLEVRGVSENITEEDLELFFENRKRSGGKEVEKVDIYRESKTALVYFVEGDAVGTVLKRAPFIFDKKKLEVAPYLHSKKSKGTSWLAGIKTKTVVKVDNSVGISDDTLEIFFESKKKSGGIMQEMKTIEDEENVYLVYRTEKEAAAVANRSHTLNKKKIHTTLYIPPEPREKYEDRFFISGIKESTSKEDLKTFLKEKAHCKPIDITYGEDPGTALVTADKSSTPIRLKYLSKVFNKRPLDGSFFEVMDVPISNCILVRNLSEATTLETLEFYFESKKSGNDVEVEVMETKETDNEGEALVFFKEHGVINKILKSRHILGKNNLEVSLYVECLGAGGGQAEPTWFKIPPSFTMERVNKLNIQFIKDNHRNNDSLAHELDLVNAEIDWTSETSVTFNCTLTEDMVDARVQVKTWKKDTEDKFEAFLARLDSKTLNILNQTWKDVSSKVATIQNDDDVAVYIFDDTHTICVVGFTEKVGDVISEVEAIIMNVENEMDRKNKEITETLKKIKPISLRFLSAMEFPKEIKVNFPRLEVDIDLTQNEIRFTGQLTEIKCAQTEMYDSINTDSKVTVQMAPGQLDFIATEAVQQYIEMKLKGMDMVGVWSIENGLVTFLSRTDQEANDVAHVVKQSIKELVIPLNDDMLRLTTSLPWKKMINDLCKDRKDIVKISVSGNKEIVVCGTDDVFDVVVEDLSNFLEEKTVYSRPIYLAKGIHRFLAKHCDAELNRIIHACRDYAAGVTCTEKVFTIKATNEGLGKLQREIHKLAKNVINEEKQFDHRGIAKLLTTEGGDQVINVIESMERCVIERSVDEDEDKTDVDSSATHIDTETNVEELTGPTKLATCNIEQKCTLMFWHGDITDLKVDVIVNAANDKLDHTGGLAKAIVDKGGKSIQDESNEIIRRNGTILVGDVAVTDPGKLLCKKIIHAVGPRWNGGRHGEETDLREAILSSLEKTEQLQFSAVSIPALSTGIYRYPVHDATRVIIGAIADHLRDVKSSSIEEIHLCDTTEKTVQEFIEAAKKKYGRTHVKKEGIKATARGDMEVSSRESKGPQQSPAVRGKSKILVKIVEGEIAKQKEDIIVNTASASLDLMNGAVSSSILAAAGKSLQQECNKQYPEGIQPGDFAVTSGGDLSCEKVFHACLPSYNNDPNCEILRSVVSECLTETSQRRCRSICFPALGAGNLGYPSEEVAKHMFESVQQYGVTNPHTTLKEVTIVLNPKGDEVVKAFRNEQSSQESKLSPAASHIQRSRRSVKTTASEDTWEQVDHADPSQVFRIGSVHLTVKTGDLTKENVKCIVNSTNEQLDLSQGGVSQAIMKAGGQFLLDEINFKRGDMRQNGVTTTTARGLGAAHVIHVSADSFKKDWGRVILACLSEAGKQGIKEIAFPALGTGIRSTTPEEMAAIFVEALMEYQSSSPQTGLIEDIRVVIFQGDMVAPFIDGVQKTGNASKGFVKNFMKKAYNFITGVAGKPDVTEITQSIQQTVSVVKLYFFSDAKINIDRAIQRIESRWKELISDEILTDPGLKNLDDSKRERLENLENRYGVKVDYQKRVGRVRLQGLSSDVIAAVKAIHKIILGEHLAVQQKEKAEILSSFIQWNYIEVYSSGESKFVPYEKILNQQFEEAYKNQEPNTTFRDQEGRLYMVDFLTMEEFPEDADTDRVEVIRKDLVKGSVDQESLPSSWTPMTSESEMVTVASGTPEYTDVEINFQKSVGGNHKVLRIDRVQTSFLWQQYMAKKRQLEAQNPGMKNEQTLWHGSASDTIASIYKNGFNRSYCGKNATVYGEGVYFAVNAAYSAQNTYSRPDSQGNKYIFQAQVLTGMFTLGKSGIRVPPTRDASKHILYDSVVNDAKSPSIYVIFNDTQAYPEYLITFT